MLDERSFFDQSVSVTFLTARDSKESKQVKNFICRKDMRPYSRLFYVKDGVITFSFTENSVKKTLSAGKGDIVYLPNNAEYVSSWENAENIDYVTVLFLLSRYDKTTVNLTSGISIIIHDSNSYYLPTLVQIVTAHRENQFGSNYYCISLLTKLIYEITQNAVRKDSNNENKIKNAIYYIENNLTKKIDIDKLAKNCNLCSSAFRKNFHATTGMSPIEYINYLKTKRAIELLLTNEYSIREVAEILNFSDEFYFSKVFKKFWGQSPKKFCEQYYPRQK